MDDRNGLGPQTGYIAKITNDAREGEMEENMGQVNTMIGNLRNMAIDMGSELENQNRQVDRINRKVSNGKRVMASECAAPVSKRCTVVRRATWHGSKKKNHLDNPRPYARRHTRRIVSLLAREQDVLKRSLDSKQE